MGMVVGVLTLLESYLTEHYQNVKIGSTESSALQVLSGVPRGSVRGPLLFNLFINDAPETIMSNCYGYADGYNVVITNTVTLQIDACRVRQWCSRYMMKLNLTKSKLLSITGLANVQLGRRFLEKTEFEKDLGIAVSLDLSRTIEAENKFEKAMKAFWSIKRNFYQLSWWITMKKVYDSYVAPVIFYGSSLCKASKLDLRRIEAAQKNAAYRQRIWSTKSAFKHSKFFQWQGIMRLMFS